MARGNVKNPTPNGEGEQRGGPVMGTAVIRGTTFGTRSVTYYDVDGMALFEGDIAIGRSEDVKAATDGARDAVAAGDPAIAFGVGVTGSQYRWPNCQIPYEIDPALPNQARVTDAIAHWEQNTPFRFPLRTPANAGSYPNYVRFSDQGGCWSFVGMQGGQQPISLGTGCSTGNAIHEIGHTVGLWHEQSREDRDLFVTINWANIQSGMAAQFNQHITDGDDLGAYDYGSIMHYPRTAFSANGQETITPTDPNAQIGQRNGLSAGDIAAVAQMYPGCQVVKPAWRDGAGIKKVIDEPIPFKKVRDDQRFKKIRDDEIVVKPIRDVPKAPGDIGPIKRDVFTNPPVVTLPGRLQPFSVVTGHQAPLGGQDALQADADSTAAYVGGLQRQLLEVEAAIAQAKATAAQANADVARLSETSDDLQREYERAMTELGGQ
jgi:Astacin (Peptidase family M12A)